MAGSIETEDDHADPDLRPVRVPIRRESVFEEALDLAGKLPGWKVLASDERTLSIECERAGGLLRAPAKVTIRVEGPEGLPSATVRCRVETSGGLLSRGRATLVEFLEPFRRRVV